MTDPVYILDLADKAARVVMGGKGYTVEDWEDAAQEAALGIWRVWGRARSEGLLFEAARHAIYDWLRVWLRHKRGGTILDYLEYPSETSAASIPDEWIDALAPHLVAVRGKRHGFAPRHIEQELTYLKLLLRGLSTDGIAMEMGLSRRNVYAIRERLVPRLMRIAGVRP